MKKCFKIKFGKIDFSKIPAKTGIYFFIGRNDQKLYIGKASNLRNRLKTYFRKNFDFENPQKAGLIKEVKKVQLEILDSEIEALIKESFLIKKYKPKYNIIFKDDKSYLFVGFTKEFFPKITITHLSKIQSSQFSLKKQSQTIKIEDLIGPFISGKALKTTLKALRKIFPFCTCLKPHKRPCLNSQIGLCLGYCCYNVSDSKILLKQYRKNISSIKQILKGNSKKLLLTLKKEMRLAAQKEDFEQAQNIKEKIIALENVLEHKKVLDKEFSGKFVIDDKVMIGQTEIDFSKIGRIEGFDVSGLFGKYPVGSMIVFEKNEFRDFVANKSEYRKFKIKTVSNINDPAMIGEIIKRRLMHQEWSLPDLIIVDGGKAQLNEALKNYTQSGINKPIIFLALAKREELVYIVNNIYPVPTKNLLSQVSLLFKAIRDEAHRFAISYHKKLRENIFHD